jgi:NitT/TauT family transport system ATP-binding protein
LLVAERPQVPGSAATRTPRISVRDVRKWFAAPDGKPYEVLGGISLDVYPGEFVSLVGPSGCGKSTLLRLVAGLIPIDGGEILIDGASARPEGGRLGFVFQQDALLPWRTVFDNIALGLRIRKLPRREVTERVNEWTARVGLRGFEAYYPARLSGGMRKRVAIAQTLSYEPDIILMDEPFAHLDVQTRQLLEEDLMNLCADGRRTILFVTHDLDEAISLSDRVVVQRAGPGSTVLSEHAVELPRPRHLIDVKVDPTFVELSHTLWQQLYEEVSRSYALRAAEVR